MERILKSFKDLFICEKPVKRHLMYVLLMILPSIAATFAGIVDKETPKEVMVVLFALAVFFLFLSFVPGLYLLGFGMEFYELRLKGEAGVPKITSELFVKGLKTLPLTIIWCIYFVAAMGIVIGFPVFVSIASAMTIKDNPIAIVAIIVFAFFLITLLFIGLIILSSFMQYVFIKFVKTYKFRAEFINPSVLVDYMRKSFKDTIMVMLKMTLTGFIVNAVTSILGGIIIVFMMAFVFISVLLIPEKAGEDNIYHPIVILLMVPFSSLAGIIQLYASSLVGFAAADQYVEIYKNKIEPTENDLDI